LVAGVTDNGLPHYSDTADQQYMNDFGIGPGCSAPADGATTCVTDGDCTGVGTGACGPNQRCLENQTALPPVRIAEVGGAYSGTMHTICSNDYAQAFTDIAAGVLAP
jgi:hypothetical protein